MKSLLCKRARGASWASAKTHFKPCFKLQNLVKVTLNSSFTHFLQKTGVRFSVQPFRCRMLFLRTDATLVNRPQTGESREALALSPSLLATLSSFKLRHLNGSLISSQSRVRCHFMKRHRFDLFKDIPVQKHLSLLLHVE